MGTASQSIQDPQDKARLSAIFKKATPSKKADKKTRAAGLRTRKKIASAIREVLFKDHDLEDIRDRITYAIDKKIIAKFPRAPKVMRKSKGSKQGSSAGKKVR